MAGTRAQRTQSGAPTSCPVVFDGPDLDEVAATVGTPSAAWSTSWSAAELEVAFVGLRPRVPLPDRAARPLAALPRRPTPRTSVPAGSVAVAAGFAAVYPRSTPGGWHLLGRTAVTLFDPDVPPQAGWHPGTGCASPSPGPTTSPAVGRTTSSGRLSTPADGPCLEVLEPGLMTTVQDGGRRGCAHLGVPAAGAADPRSLTLVNLLLGNGPGSAALECTASGPTLRVGGDGYLAVVGVAPGSVEVTVDGHPVPDCTVLPVTDGQVVCIGRVRRACGPTSAWPAD